MFVDDCPCRSASLGLGVCTLFAPHLEDRIAFGDEKFRQGGGDVVHVPGVICLEGDPLDGALRLPNDPHLHTYILSNPFADPVSLPP